MQIKHLLTLLFLAVSIAGYAQQGNCYDDIIPVLEQYYKDGKIEQAKEYIKDMEQLCEGEPTASFLAVKEKVYAYGVHQEYQSYGDFHEGLALVELNGKYGFVDKNGIEIIKPKYDNTAIFSEGLACVELNGKSFYIDKEGYCVMFHDNAPADHPKR